MFQIIYENQIHNEGKVDGAERKNEVEFFSKCECGTIIVELEDLIKELKDVLREEKLRQSKHWQLRQNFEKQVTPVFL